MSRNQTIKEISADSALMSRWRTLINSGDLTKMLELANCFRRPYNADAEPSPHPHIQSEQNGGSKGWAKLEYLLQSLPYKDQLIENTGYLDYVGFIKDNLASRKQRDFTE